MPFHEIEFLQKRITLLVGASVVVGGVEGDQQNGLKVSFQDLDLRNSPIVEIMPEGLKRFRLNIFFSRFAGPALETMKSADKDALQLARDHLASISQSANVVYGAAGNINDWRISDVSSSLTVTTRRADNRFDKSFITEMCDGIVVPMMAAISELLGYAEVQKEGSEEMEGNITVSLVKRRERSSRNRIRCLEIHGEKCFICGLIPQEKYQKAGGILEVHHLHPLALVENERLYDPSSDLVPLCPNCHRAVHTRKPTPWSPEEIKTGFGGDG